MLADVTTSIRHLLRLCLHDCDSSCVLPMSSDVLVQGRGCGLISRPNQGSQEAQQAATPAAAAAVSERLASRASLTSMPSHRHTTSFTAVMDPSGLNIIEDYARMESELLPRMDEVPERSTHSSPADTPASLLATAEESTVGAAADMSAAEGAAVTPRSYSLPALQSPAGSDTARSRTSSPNRPPSRLSQAAMPAAAVMAGSGGGVAASPVPPHNAAGAAC